MTAIRSDGQNAFVTQLTAEMGPNDLTAAVGSLGALASPSYLVIDYDNDSLREIVLFDGTFSGLTFATGSIGNRYLEGSAAGSNLTHAIGAKVISAPVSQQISDLHDRVENVDHGALTGLGDDDHTQYLLKAGGTLTGDLVLNADPDADMKAATKQYVDAIATGLAFVQEYNTQSKTVSGTGTSDWFTKTITIPAGWLSFYVEVFADLSHDPIGYADGDYGMDLKKSDQTQVRSFGAWTYDHGHSDPIMVSLTGVDGSNGSPLLFAADFLGDREIDVVIDGREQNHGGNGTIYLKALSIKLTRAT